MTRPKPQLIDELLVIFADTYQHRVKEVDEAKQALADWVRSKKPDPLASPISLVIPQVHIDAAFADGVDLYEQALLADLETND